MSVHSWSLIEIDDDGSTVRSRSLSTSGVFLTQHVPNEAADQRGVVTETINVLFEASGSDTAQEIAQEVRTYLTQAERKADRVFLLFSTLEEATTWRSPLVGGLIEWGPDALRAFSSGKIEASIILQRLNWWERHDAETTLCSAVAMTNNGASYASLSDPGGTLPTPVRVELTNSGAGVDSRRLFLAINTDNDPGTIDLTLPGGTSSWTGARVYSDGYDAIDGVNGRHFTYAFTKTELSRLRGEKWHVLVAFASITGAYYVRARIYYVSGATYKPLAWTSDYLVNDAGIALLSPALAIPPTGTGTNSGAIALAINMRDDTATAGTAGSYTVDYIQLLPANPPLRRLYQTGWSTATGDKWIDDGRNDQAYIYDTSVGYNIPTIEASGPPLEAIPGKTSALHVIFDEYTGGLDDTHAFTATVKCRPRRATL